MHASQSLARPLLAGVFVHGGIDTFRKPEKRVAVASPVLERLQKLTPVPVGCETLVRANAAGQVAAAVLLGLGIRPRLAAAALAASLVPTTLGGHRFWEQDDQGARAQQTVHFLKNLAILGGLLVAAQRP
jgi:uncharacterized membrane protein YphA (DoxX/SURF4 family)